MNPEQGPRPDKGPAPEEPLEIELPGEYGGVSDQEYKNEALRQLYQEKMAYSRELAAWQEEYKKRKEAGELSQEQEKQYQERMDGLREKIALVSKDKVRAQRQFEEHEKRQAA